ncbi:hypothetical protein DI09_23p200 [Mitosporidium daphniae]|uniref:Uncharacterized protein n=1 Tax=Mitosporidium daphniae TaxID=1485682 RepID=A0A098VSK7_9MICR|nr:uncharacterized protein DI09_23p200 [Mitosporidium daphniae]KGG51945.1 hypothetical protein DI09_23p200 [Mitosporidium daphniae]|eukprot:XP_013238372.1 uncharacterized protein DI09_23p200 [Mitosporidium daphniae]
MQVCIDGSIKGLAIGVEQISENITDEMIDSMLDTNVKGVLYVTREILPKMLQSGRNGHIIMIGSIAGVEAYSRGSIYCASKHALNAISESLRKELISTPIRVTEIQPGLVETEFSLVRYGGDVHAAKRVYNGIEALSANDVAEVVLFAATRPKHVQIATVKLLPTNQASVFEVSRTKN